MSARYQGLRGCHEKRALKALGAVLIHLPEQSSKKQHFPVSFKTSPAPRSPHQHFLKRTAWTHNNGRGDGFQ